MDRLIEGYRRFRANVWPAERARYELLAQTGQSPETLVIACSDSRVDPQTVFGAGPGELFVVRNVAGLVPPYRPDASYHGTSAALEYGVRVLKVARIIVLGHALCGGVRVMVRGAPEQARDFVEPWIRIAEAVRHQFEHAASVEDDLGECEKAVIRLSLTNLLTFPWISEAVRQNNLQLDGFRFDIRTGCLTMLKRDRFESVA
jgi:carbonic anhydrase